MIAFMGLSAASVALHGSYQEPRGATGARLRPMGAIILGHNLGTKSPQTKLCSMWFKKVFLVILRVLSDPRQIFVNVLLLPNNN